ncbi:kinetochore protein Spc24 isoform X1 [Cricetulus griseus]|uniref:Kinetochore protein Spc24 n=1 Tax=Cricetulus griseus TaxID=10029 RepID=A0A9J7JNN2_CRIGR|nr:kinetochore protein Spc24 isoform X1 [Cricetulus griseus]XP_027267372.1 kinetochore protein Spc24 isoform X2 [Cricetulus griseus]
MRPVMAAFREMEEVSSWLLSLLGANHVEKQQRQLLGRHEQMVERLLETQDGADQRLRETLAVEEEAAQSLLELKECMRLGGNELQHLEVELQKASKEDACLQASLCQLTTELQELREMEADLQQQEREVDEDTTITIPSAVYVAHLYHQISKIEWDYECEPGTIKGIHHGPTVALPIHLDSAQLSQKFISDYLWSLVDTAW